MAPFQADLLRTLAREQEVDIETRRPDGSPRRTTIWVVVDGDQVYAASYAATRGRWYRDLLADPSGALHLAGRRVPIRASGAPEAAPRYAEALRAKYAGDASLPAMLTEEVLATTLRLERGD
jgi:hypothetical protein